MMLRQHSKKTRRKTIVITSVAALTAFAVVGALWLWPKPASVAQTTDDSQTRPVNTVDYGPPNEQDVQDSNDHKQDIIDTPQTPPASPLTITIIRASQTSPGKALNIRTMIDGAQTGSCDITLGKSGQKNVTATFQIAFNATSYSCNGDIDASAFAQAGEWQLKATAKNGSSQSSTVTQVVTITK